MGRRRAVVLDVGGCRARQRGGHESAELTGRAPDGIVDCGGEERGENKVEEQVALRQNQQLALEHSCLLVQPRRPPWFSCKTRSRSPTFSKSLSTLNRPPIFDALKLADKLTRRGEDDCRGVEQSRVRWGNVAESKPRLEARSRSIPPPPPPSHRSTPLRTRPIRYPRCRSTTWTRSHRPARPSQGERELFSLFSFVKEHAPFLITPLRFPLLSLALPVHCLSSPAFCADWRDAHVGFWLFLSLHERAGRARTSSHGAFRTTISSLESSSAENNLLAVYLAPFDVRRWSGASSLFTFFPPLPGAVNDADLS
jgi:hypothetical protein